MLLLGLEGLLKDKIGLRNNGVIIFGVMSVVLRKVVFRHESEDQNMVGLADGTKYVFFITFILF